MSLTARDAAQIVFDHLQNSVLFTDVLRPTGELYHSGERPQGSDKEDVVINIIGLNRAVIQRGRLNVNIYVNNLKVWNNGAWDYTQPNTLRLAILSRLANQALEEVGDPTGNWTFTVLDDTDYPDTNNQHYLNFRVDFRAVNIQEH